MCSFRRTWLYWYLILLEAHCPRGQKALIPVLDGERQVLVKHLQVSLDTQQACESTVSPKTH